MKNWISQERSITKKVLKLPQRLHIGKSSFLAEIIFKKMGSHSHQTKIGDTNLYKGKHLQLKRKPNQNVNIYFKINQSKKYMMP